MHAFQGFTAGDVTEARQARVDLGNRMQWNISENDVLELLEFHAKELSTEVLMQRKGLYKPPNFKKLTPVLKPPLQADSPTPGPSYSLASYGY